MECGCTVPPLGPSLRDTCGGGAFLLFMSLLDTFIRNKCDLSDACGRITPRTQPDASYDFVVVGGGSGGAVVAARLSEVAEWRVLLLEAGGDEPAGAQVPSMVASFHGNAAMDWNYKTEPEAAACLGYAEKRCEWTRAKVLGGCGVINGMMYMRGLARDYDNWERAGCVGWGSRDVLAAFKKSEDNEEIGRLVEEQFHARGGPMTVSRFPDQPELVNDVLEAAEKMGWTISPDLNGRIESGFTVAQANIRNGSRLSSARAYLRPARTRPNLHIMLNSTGARILFTTAGERKTVTGVEFLYRNKLHRVQVKREVIVSGGAVNSPQILLLSGVGPRAELARVGIAQVHQLPGVGLNLHNHVTFYMTYLLKKQKDVNELNWANALDYILNRSGPMSSTGMSQLTARINSRYADPSGAYPDLQIFFIGMLASCAASGEVGALKDETHPDHPKSVLISPVVLHPKSRGHIGLKSKNPMDAPAIYANYLSEQEDVATLIDGIRVIQRLANSTGLRQKYGIELDREEYGDCAKRFGFDSDDYWQCAVRFHTGPENHQAGSCKMGPATDKMAVVDPKLLVHGLDNVRVIDASIMPAVVSGNTHATVVMIAEKGADFIKARWLGAPNVQNRFGGQDSQPPAKTHGGFQHNEQFHKNHPSMPNPFNKRNTNQQTGNVHQNYQYSGHLDC